MKRFLSIFLIMLFLTACTFMQTPSTPVPSETPVPIDTEEPVVLATPAVQETPIPVPTDTPEPTATPEPTPEPTPTPIPYDDALEAKKREALMTDRETFTVVMTRGAQPYLVNKPGSSDRIYPFKKQDGIYLFDWIVLDTVEENGSYYYVRAIGAKNEGYLATRSLANYSRMQEPESTYAMMVRPNGIVYQAHTLDSPIVGHANYDVVRVVGKDENYACIITSDGATGYVEHTQLVYLTKDLFDEYLHLSCQCPESTFDRSALPTLGMEYVGKAYSDSAEFLYDLLKSTGLHFNEGYYRFYQKPFDQKTQYPNNLYLTPVYNSLLFKLFNSSGMQVTANGAETEWAYIDSYDKAEPGDLLFFSDPSGKGDAVVPGVEVVLHGQYSGDVTDCGLFLGDGSMLCVENGAVAVHAIDIVEISRFDSARRVYPTVTDERAHLIESMISIIYDRLAVPYRNGHRVGDASYDCSGIISWVFRCFDYDMKKDPSGTPLEIVASDYGHIDKLYSPTTVLTLEDTGIPQKDFERLAELQRGDLVTLMNENRSRIGHVMVYLGNNTVIHSTSIQGKYRGVLVAQFRSHLQYLYACSRRIGEISPR